MRASLQFIFLALGLQLILMTQASALVELRVHYSLSNPSQNISDLCRSCSNPSNAPGMVSNSGIGADLIVSLPVPVNGFGVGLRYENTGFTTNLQGIEARASHTRTAALVNYRLLDNMIFFGPIATYGIAHAGSFDISENAVKIHEYAVDQATSYSIGAEAGFRLIAFTITAEAGYAYEKWNEARSSLGTPVSNDINFSGTYAKLHLGFAY